MCWYWHQSSVAQIRVCVWLPVVQRQTPEPQHTKLSSSICFIQCKINLLNFVEGFWKQKTKVVFMKGFFNNSFPLPSSLLYPWATIKDSYQCAPPYSFPRCWNSCQNVKISPFYKEVKTALLIQVLFSFPQPLYFSPRSLTIHLLICIKHYALFRSITMIALTANHTDIVTPMGEIQSQKGNNVSFHFTDSSNNIF